ncbi:MAG TPA: arylsulfatase [Acidimicrobiales bacterium]|jgi:arylsulfatase|nr:arylsulfatase [Acidimicrobiales bacterium]
MTTRMSEATPGFVPYPKPPDGAPNVLVIVLDDVGFAQLGCFGSPIETPAIDRLAAGGLRYNRFHVTSICSASRAALLTGRNHHAVGVGMTMETPLGFPGYTGRIPASAAMLPRVLKDRGYNTFAVGKWHLIPRGEYSSAGPMTRWPLGAHMGFERYYGFLGAETNQWSPELWRDNTPTEPPATPAEGYHLTADLADQAIAMLRDQRQAASAKPWFVYFAPGAAHAPHQVPKDWSDPYRGRFDAGWEELRSTVFGRQVAEGIVPDGTRLTDRPSWIPAWSELDDEHRRLYARYMEVFAGFLTHTDAQIGRLLAYLESSGVADDTIVLLMSDNGASAEGTATGTLNESAAWLGHGGDVAEAVARIDEIGGHTTFNHYPWGWAWAGNTPLQLWKRYAWLGGVRTPLIVRWPGRLAEPGSIRSQFCHAVDLAPTLLDVIGIEPPDAVDGVAQQMVDGASLSATFSEPGAPEPRSTQYFEMHGSRAVYHEGWKATTDYVSPLFGERDHLSGSQDFDTDRWSMFDLTTDFAEAVDLSAEQPERLADLERLWWSEAERNQVLPLFEGPSSLVALHPAEYPAPSGPVTYEPGGAPIYEGALPAMFGGFTISADIDGVGDGVICALGDLNDGFALYLLDRVPVATIVSGGTTTRLAGPHQLSETTGRIGMGLGRGQLSLLVDGEVVASTVHLGMTMFPAVGTAAGGLLVGRDRGLAVSGDYEPPFPFTGTLRRITFSSGGPDRRPAADEVARAQAVD